MSTVPTGWLCPKCQVVHAPTVLECRCAQVAQPYVVGPPPKIYVGSPTVPSTSEWPAERFKLYPYVHPMTFGGGSTNIQSQADMVWPRNGGAH